MSEKVLLAGTGPMALEYFKVLKELGIEAIIVGRGETSAQQFEKETNSTVFRGGIEKWLKETKDYPKKAIVAVTENLLGKVTKQLIDAGLKDILVEKPGGLDFNDIESVNDKAIKHKARVLVGYNRRFYSSVEKAKEIINADGGVSSFNFEFTEWAHVIAGLTKAEGVLEEWYLQNSSHVIDLAFYLGGHPVEISSYISGKLSWHTRASAFAGAGVSDSGALFSYQANWEAPGRWSVEILTKKHRLILRPMEKLQIQNTGSVAIEACEIDDEYDIKFKPGIYRQTEDFINNNGANILTIAEQVKNLKIYRKIINGN